MTTTKQRAVVIGLILLGLIIVGFFGLRFFHAFRDFRGHHPPRFPRPGDQPAQTDVELIRDWMTIPYISMTYRLPSELLFETLKIPPKGNEHKSLKQLNDEYYHLQSDYVLKLVKETIKSHEPPTPVPTVTITPTPTP
jgi:hypothetical protein